MIAVSGNATGIYRMDLDSPEPGSLSLQQHNALNGFLSDIERRALRMAELSTGNRDDAMEIVQDAMLGLVKRYSRRPEGEWKPLFYRILQSRIKDFHRRRVVRTRVLGFLATPAGGDTEPDPLDSASAGERENPLQAMQREIANDAMMKAIGSLPTRQQQAFLLRSWEGLSVRDTSIAMACSEGSVKTHYNRAIKALQHSLAGFQTND